METLIYHSVSYSKKRALTATWKSWFMAAFIVAEWLLGVQSVLAQNYPVQSTVQLAPPYSIYLADYVAPGTNRLSINVLLTELDRVEYPVKLRVTIEGGGVTLRTHDRYAPAPIILQGGMLEMLTAVDLAPYFDPMNLQFSGGLRSDQFQRTGQLPEGFYRFCVEVLDYNSGTVVSNTGCASAWLILNEPPLINLPQADSKVRAQEPPNLIFQWTPRHLGSPNAAFTTEYELTLVELWPANRNPNDAVLSTVPLFQTSTTSTTYVYGMADPPLEPGRRYAFRVQARSMTGLEALDLFKNQGYSEVVSFTYGDACTLPTQLTATALSATRLKLSWQTSLMHTGYTVRYREASSRTSRWIEETSYLDALTLSGLKPNTEYEYQLQSLCGTISGDYSPVATVRTLPREDNPMVCGLPPPAFDMGNQSRLEYLFTGDYLYAGDFDVQVTEVQASAAGFSGTGISEMPLLSLARVRVAFDNIQVNTDYRVIDGNIYSLGDPTKGGVLDLDEKGPVVLDNSVSENKYSEPINNQADNTEEKTSNSQYTAYKSNDTTGVNESETGSNNNEQKDVIYDSKDHDAEGDKREKEDNDAPLTKNNDDISSGGKGSLAEKPFFDIKNLWAIDSDNTARRAEQEETLYLIRKSNTSRKVNYELDIDAGEEDFWEGQPFWSINEESGTALKSVNKKNYYTTYSNSPMANTVSVEVFKQILSVNIETISFYKTEADVVPVGIKNALKILSEKVNEAGTVFHKIDKSGKLEFKCTFTGSQYVEEDEASRFYYTWREGGIGGGIEFTFKGFEHGLRIPGFDNAKAVVFVKPILSLTSTGSVLYSKRNDEEEFQKKDFKLSGAFKADIQVGGEAKVDVLLAEATVKPYGGIGSNGSLEYIKSKNSINYKFSFGQPYIGMNISFEALGYDVVPPIDAKYVWEDIEFTLSPGEIPLD